MTLRRTQADVDSDRRILAIEVAVGSLQYDYDDLVSALLSPGITPDGWLSERDEVVWRIQEKLGDSHLPEGTTVGEFLVAIGNVLRHAGGAIVRDERRERNADAG